jgi:hypothetical protein
VLQAFQQQEYEKTGRLSIMAQMAGVCHSAAYSLSIHDDGLAVQVYNERHLALLQMEFES